MNYFGTDGIRRDEKFFTVEFLGKVANAVALRYGKCTVMMARDPRKSGERIRSTLATHLKNFGCRVLDIGMTPTPVLAYATRAYGAALGIMISASHNPPDYNGLKFFAADGAKITTEEEKNLAKLIDTSDSAVPARGNITTLDLNDEYCAHFARLTAPEMQGKKVLLDCANGASSLIAPRLYSMLGAEVTAMNTETDGININKNCGATHPEILSEAMRSEHYDIGFTFDGDCDRVLCFKGDKLYDGDDMIYVAARFYKESGGDVDCVAGTIMSNMGTENSLREHGIELVRTPVGDKYVSEKMCADGIRIGGEASGHIIFRDYQNTGDGLLTSLIMSKIDGDVGLDTLYDCVQYPAAHADVDTDKEGIARFGSEAVARFLDEERKGFAGRIIARASGTEPKIRLMTEAEQYEQAYAELSKVKAFIIKTINTKIDNKDNETECCGSPNLLNNVKLCEKLNQAGVSVLDPATTYIGEDVEIGAGSVIYPMNVISGKSRIGENVRIYSYCDLTDVVIGDNADLRSTYAIGAHIGVGTTVGPFACLRKGARIGGGCRVGDFVEVKNATLGDGVKAAHLAYIGDAEVGERTNVGCGTVFANYNGKVKQQVKVGKGVFIGCNANLIAPLEVGDGAYIAGGSTVTEDIPGDTLCIARSRQVIKQNWRK